MASDEPPAEAEARPLQVRHVRRPGNSASTPTAGPARREDLPPMQRARGTLTTADVMTYAKVSRATVDRATHLYRRSHGTRGLRFGQTTEGGHRRFRLTDVDAWLEQAAQPQRHLRTA